MVGLGTSKAHDISPNLLALFFRVLSPQIADQFVRKEANAQFDRVLPEYFAKQWSQPRDLLLEFGDARETLVQVGGRTWNQRYR